MDTSFRRKSALLALLLAGCLLTGCVPAVVSAPVPTAEPTENAGAELVLLTPAPEDPVPAAEETPVPEDWEPTPVPTLAPDTPTPAPSTAPTPTPLPEDGIYTSRDEVALYIHTYGRLPSNFITKKDAQALGWPGGSLDDYAPGMCIGGDWFGNYEGLLPRARGRTWQECDIDTLHARSRGAKRIVFSNDGLIYYTGDHFESFSLLYGEE